MLIIEGRMAVMIHISRYQEAVTPELNLYQRLVYKLSVVFLVRSHDI